MMLLMIQESADLGVVPVVFRPVVRDRLMPLVLTMAVVFSVLFSAVAAALPPTQVRALLQATTMIGIHIDIAGHQMILVIAIIILFREAGASRWIDL
jgi:hypothetical protein